MHELLSAADVLMAVFVWSCIPLAALWDFWFSGIFWRHFCIPFYITLMSIVNSDAPEEE